MEFKDPVGAHRSAGIPVTDRTWTDEQIQGEDVKGVIFQNCVFERVRLDSIALNETTFLDSRFDDCVFDNCQIVETCWVNCSGSGLRISNGVFREAVFSQNHLSELTIEQSGDQITLAQNTIGTFALNGAGGKQYSLTISGCKFRKFSAENALWTHASVVELDASVWSMDNAVFDQCSLVKTIGEGVDFSAIRFQACNLYQGMFRGARFRFAEKSIFAECELSEADFIGASLAGAMFSKSIAVGARFNQACLDGALFPKATLTGANMSGASAKQSIWIDADLTTADLTGMDAYRGSFRNAILKDAIVTNARFVETDLHGVKEPLEGADLRDSRGSVDWRAELEEQAKANPQ